jgi:hypothetical protein
MQEYDVALKLLLRGSAKLTLRELTGTVVENWVDAELLAAAGEGAILAGQRGPCRQC